MGNSTNHQGQTLVSLLGIEPLATFCFVSQLSNSHLQATRLTKIKYRLLYPNRHEQRDLRCFLNNIFKTVKNNSHSWYDGKIDAGNCKFLVKLGIHNRTTNCINIHTINILKISEYGIKSQKKFHYFKKYLYFK